MKRIILSALALLALAGCGANNAATSTAASLVSGYIIAANGALAFETAHPAAAPAVRACDNVAWAAIGPISQALAAGHDPTPAEMNAANAAVTALSPCLTAAGVSAP